MALAPIGSNSDTIFYIRQFGRESVVQKNIFKCGKPGNPIVTICFCATDYRYIRFFTDLCAENKYCRPSAGIGRWPS